MANGLDPRIALAAQAPDIGATFTSILQNIERSQGIARESAESPIRSQLLNLELEQAQAQQPVALQEAKEALDPVARLNRRERARLVSTVQAAQLISPLLEAGDIKGVKRALNERKKRLANLRIDTTETDEAIALADNDPELLKTRINQALNIGRQAGIIRPSTGASARAFAPIGDPTTGQLSTPVFDPATRQTTLQPIAGAFEETPAQESARTVEERRQIADIDVRKTQRTETIKQRVKRTSDIKKEFSERNRQAARSKIKIAEAQKLVGTATQGLGGFAKLQLARVFPGIDAGDEAGLVGAFKSLALDELQKFTGPTTDFEFRVTEDIAGSLGDGKFANTARLASLERATWFVQREAQQFSKHVKAGHDPDEFGFDFNEKITPKKGGRTYSLRQLQDTAVANHISIDEVIKRLSR